MDIKLKPTKNYSQIYGTALLLIIMMACAPKQPVLYPDEQLESVGKKASKDDINDCIRLAEESGLDSDQTGEVVGDTALGAAVGGATGVAVGAIHGRTGRGAASGAAAGGIAGLVRGLFRSREPEPVFRNYVEKCLQDREYTTIGWR